MKSPRNIKRIAPALCFMCVCHIISAQLSNGGFESNTGLPSNMGEWQVLQDWNNCGSFLSSPDYYHYLSPASADIPETPMAIVEAYEGSAIAGIIAGGKDHTNIREYLSTPLSSPLEPGRQYMCGFKITNGAKTETSYAGLGLSDLGVLFSTAQPVQIDQTPMEYNPQFRIDTVLYDREWQTINFVFTASEAYAFMTFGVFAMDADIQIQAREGADPLFAYYFLDDFYLEELPDDYDPLGHSPGKGDPKPGNDPVSEEPSSPSPFFIPNSFSPNGDQHNQLFMPVGNTISEWKFSIYSVWGEKVFETIDEFTGWDGKFNGDECPNGNYVWQIEYTVWNDKTGPREIVKKGIVVLLR